MTIKNTIPFWRKIYNKHENSFKKNSIYSFSNLLWQIIVNEAREDQICCFTPVLVRDSLQLSIVVFGESGHHPTYVEFADKHFASAESICDYLNKEVFGLNTVISEKIVIRSMQGLLNF